jgi:hypothetical protein
MSRDPDNLTDVSDLPPPGPPTDPLACALAGLEPAEPELNRDRLMFLAGAESRRSTIRLWQFTAGILAAVGFAAGARMYFQPPVVVEVERIVYVDRDGTPSPAVAPMPREVAPNQPPQPGAPDANRPASR